MTANNEDMLSFSLRLGQRACTFCLGNAFASIVPFSCGGASDAPQLAARVRRRRLTVAAKSREAHLLVNSYHKPQKSVCRKQPAFSLI